MSNDIDITEKRRTLAVTLLQSLNEPKSEYGYKTKPLPKGTDPALVAKALLAPSMRAGKSVQAISGTEGAELLAALATELQQRATAIKSGDMSGVEEMLVAQAHTLDALFNRLTAHGVSSSGHAHANTYLKLAMRAQNQARATLETLSYVKNPPGAVQFVRQQNIAQGHQQVVNGSLPQQPGGHAVAALSSETAASENLRMRAPARVRVEKSDALEH